MDLLGLGLMSGGIKCRECNSVVPNRVGLAHLHANGINCYELYAPFLACVYVGAVLTPAMESAFIAKKYNTHGYECLNKHSGGWIVDN